MADEERGTLYGHSIPDGPVVRPPADPERDARIKAYRARERARVVEAFDRFLERMFDDPYGVRPDWAAPPVWLRTEAEVRGVGGDHANDGPRVTMCPHGVPDFNRFPCMICGFPTEQEGLHQKAHYGVPLAPGWIGPRDPAEPYLNVGDADGSVANCTDHDRGDCPYHTIKPDYAPGVTTRDESGVVSHECPSDGQTCSYPLHDPEPCSMAYWYDFGRWEWAPAYLLIEAGVPARMCKLSGPHASHLPGDTSIGPDDEDPRAYQG